MGARSGQYRQAGHSRRTGFGYSHCRSAKNDKHQTHELLFGDPLEVVELSRNSQEFFLLQRIQDEVHRFAITFHRQLRSKNSFSSQLDGIEGLGPKRKAESHETFQVSDKNQGSQCG